MLTIRLPRPDGREFCRTTSSSGWFHGPRVRAVVREQPPHLGVPLPRPHLFHHENTSLARVPPPTRRPASLPSLSEERCAFEALSWPQRAHHFIHGFGYSHYHVFSTTNDMALNNIGDRIASSLNDFFSPSEDARQSKFHKGEKGGGGKSASSSEKRAGAETRIPFNPEQCDWLQGALKHSLANFGAAVAEEMQAVRGIAESTKEIVDRVDNRVEGFKEQTERSMAELKNDIDELRRKVELGEAARASAEAAPQPSTPQPARPSTAQDDQDLSLGRLGNLGWDTEETELSRRSAEVLDAAQIPKENVAWTSPLTGRGGTGSAVQVKFVTPAKLQLAKARIRDLKKSYEESRYVWLDIQKSREQLRPARMIH